MSRQVRPTADYRNLNTQTVPDRYPISQIYNQFLQLHGKTVFSTITYFEIPVTEEDVTKTTVNAPFGLFELIGMSLGLRNATQTL